MTKKEQGFVNNYIRSMEFYGIRHLEDVYTKCSAAKQRAWDAICAECCDNFGYCLTIVSYNSMVFTAAYYITDHNTEKSTLIYHTPTHKYIIPLD